MENGELEFNSWADTQCGWLQANNHYETTDGSMPSNHSYSSRGEESLPRELSEPMLGVTSKSTPTMQGSIDPPRHLKEFEIAGGSTPSQYALPINAGELQDLIEYREMNFALGNIFKAVYRLGNCSHSNAKRDLNKIIWFAERELKRHED